MRMRMLRELPLRYMSSPRNQDPEAQLVFSLVAMYIAFVIELEMVCERDAVLNCTITSL